MSDVSRILSLAPSDQQAASQLFPLVYDELRVLAAQKLARELPGQTLQATALVHEAYLRLVGHDEIISWESRRHFFAAAAEAMRRILVDRAKRKKLGKREIERRAAEGAQQAGLGDTAADILDVHEALDKLAAHNPDVAELVKLHYFAGLSIEEAAATLQIPERTAYRNWSYARSWLFRHFSRPLPSRADT